MASVQASSSWHSSCLNTSHQSSPLEQLPPELLIKCLRYVTYPRNGEFERYNLPGDINANVVKEHVSLLPALVTSRTLSSTAITLIYRNPSISSLQDLEAIVENLTADHRLNKFVRRLDLRQITPARDVPKSQERITSLLLNLLSRTPLLQELYLDQNLGNHLDENGLRIIFEDLKQLHTLHITNCESRHFTESLVAASDRWSMKSTALRNLSLKKCSNLPVEVFTSMLSSIPNMKYLDVSSTQVNAEALGRIPRSARLRRLNLSHCTNITGQELANLLSNHPAATSSLASLDLSQSPEERTTDETELSEILSNLPPTIRSLGLGHCRSSPSHIPLLQSQYGNLECLTVGSDLLLRDVEDIVLSPGFEFATAAEDDETLSPPPELKYQSVLASMEKAVAICKSRRRIDSVVPRTDCAVTQQSKLRYLDITSLSIPEQSKIGCSVLLSKNSWPLAVIEISNTVVLWNELLSGLCEALGWRIRKVEKRCWLERRVGT